METNFSDYMSSRILYQLGNDELLYLAAFFSKNLNLTKCNYKIYNKVLLAIIQYFK